MNLLCIGAGGLTSQADTTRQPRAGEQDGREYNFVTKEKFTEMIDQGAFIEHAQFGSNFYGTSVKAVKDVAQSGSICVLDIEIEVNRSNHFGNAANGRLRE